MLIVNAGVKRLDGEGGRLNDTLASFAREAFAAADFIVLETDLKKAWVLEEGVAKVAAARLLLVQTPIWAMTAPWQYIRWQDEVLTHPKVCGTDGRTRTWACDRWVRPSLSRMSIRIRRSKRIFCDGVMRW